PVGAGADAWLRAGLLAQPTTASMVATIRTGRRSGRARLTYKDLLLTHGDGPAPPTLVAGESDVLPGHVCCAGAVTNREPHVSARGEVSGMGLPRRPLVARSAAGNESDKSGGAQRRQCEVPESHRKASSDVTVVTPQVQRVCPLSNRGVRPSKWERTCRVLDPGYPRFGHDGPRGPRSHPAPGTVARDLHGAPRQRASAQRGRYQGRRPPGVVRFRGDAAHRPLLQSAASRRRRGCEGSCCPGILRRSI